MNALLQAKNTQNTQTVPFSLCLVLDQCYNKYGHRVTAWVRLARGRTRAYFRADLPHSLPASNQLLAAVLPVSSLKRFTMTDWAIASDNIPLKQSQFQVQLVLTAMPRDSAGSVAGKGNGRY